MRRALSTTQRLELYLTAKGHCQACGWRLMPGTRWEVDHIVPLALGGTDTPDNLQVLCSACHGSKTRERDLPALGKARRRQARHLGAVRARAVIPGSRRSRWKKRLDGRVEERVARAAARQTTDASSPAADEEPEP
jgi:5-methylcytosine-specific restriction protein A